MSYCVTRALEEHLPFLPQIERLAGTLFRGQDLPEHVFEDTTSLEELRAAMQAGHLWVALDDTGQPVGFAQAQLLGELLHLEEVDVTPSHGRRGLGRRLVEAVCACADVEGCAAVTLTTFSDVPWNAPFYQKLGFRNVPHAELPSFLTAIFEDEIRGGLPRARRVVMRKWVGRAADA